MITNKEQLYNTKLRTKGRNLEIIAKLKELKTVDCNSELLSFKTAPFLYFDSYSNWSYTDEDNGWFENKDYKEITVEELLGEDKMEYIAIIELESESLVGGLDYSDKKYTWKGGETDYSRRKHNILVTADREFTIVTKEESARYTLLPKVKYTGNFIHNTEPELNQIIARALKNKEVKQEYTVDKEFILAGHKAACPDWKTKIEEKFPELFLKPLKQGDKFIRLRTDEEYILARVGDNTMALIMLSNGNLWSSPVKVIDPHKITNEEMNTITSSYTWEGKFKLKQ